jgi:hypothetical protein
MKLGKTYITDKLTESGYRNALKVGVHIIVCRNSVVEEVAGGIKIICGGNFRIPAGWWLREILINRIKKLPKSWSVHEGISLTSTLLKLNYWSFHKEAQVAYGAMKSKVKVNTDKILFRPRILSSWVIANTKWVVFKFKRLSEVKVVAPQKRIVFYITSDTDVEVWQNLISEFEHSEILLVLKNQRLIENEIIKIFKQQGYEAVLVGQIPGKKYNPLPQLSKDTSVIQRNIFSHVQQLNHFFSIANWLLSIAPRCVLFNAGENKDEVHLLSEKLLAVDVKTFNTMNGIKAKTANNADVQFSKWFVWDVKMKEILMNCQIQESMLQVSGHLMNDYASKYTFKHRLAQTENYYQAKPVIAFFSINDEIQEKKDVYAILPTLLGENHFMIKEHPTYKGDDRHYYHNFTNNYEVIKGRGSKDVLYDILSIADLVVVLGSTIAIEATWFNTPVITVEYKQESILYCVDGKAIKHLSSHAELVQYFETNKVKKKTVNKQQESNVALEYKRVIKSLI